MRGFTLLELLAVMVIVGIVLGAVTLNAMPDSQQVLREDARRVALLLQLAREEAIVRNRPVAFEADAWHYRFLVSEGNVWQALERDDLLREREFEHPPVDLSLRPVPGGQTAPLRVIFGREPVHPPFVLMLAAGSAQAAIHADGAGHFRVE